MPMDGADVLDRFSGALLGFAIGDALGFPLHGIPAPSLWNLPGVADDFAPRPRGRFAKGQFSGHTQLLLAALEGVVAERKVEGRSIAAQLAWLHREGVWLDPDPVMARAAERLEHGTPWMSAGAPLGELSPGGLPLAVVVGLWDAAAPHKLSHDAGVAAVISHKDPACAAALSALARAVALGFEPQLRSPEEFCAELAQAARAHHLGLADRLRQLPRLLLVEPARARAALLRGSAPEAGVPPRVETVVQVAVYAALAAGSDPRRAMELGLRWGGETALVAGCVGAIVGAHLGASALPARLRTRVLYAQHLHSAAERLLASRPAPARALAPAVIRSR